MCDIRFASPFLKCIAIASDDNSTPYLTPYLTPSVSRIAFLSTHPTQGHYTMPLRRLCQFPSVTTLALFLSFATASSAIANDGPAPVVMGAGEMTFATVPGWGLLPDGSSAIGPTHGSVVIDEEGNIYTSAKKGVVVFAPEGKVIREYLGADYSNIHDMEIRKEGDAEYIYGARNANAEGIKFKAKGGEIV
ncbi:MAG: hypothetical protein AAGG44_15405, partial [Planctomycetota bacterium]